MRFFFLSHDKMALFFLLFCTLVLVSALFLVYNIDKVIQSKNDTKVDEIHNYIHSPISPRSDPPKADIALHYMMIEFHTTRNENALLSILKLYLFGLNPHYSPNKITGLKIIQFINDNSHHFSKNFVLHCKVLWEQTSAQIYNDPDIIGTLQLPDNIIDKISIAIQHHQKNNIELKPCSIQYLTFHEENNDDEDEYIATVVNEENDDVVHINADENTDPRRITVKSDSQNVHNITIPNSVHVALNHIINLNSTMHVGTFKDAFTSYQQELQDSDLDSHTKHQSIQVVRSLTSCTHSKFRMSEQQVFAHVYTRIRNSENKISLINLFTQNLASAIEHDSVVCSTGKITRMVSTFDVVDDEIPDLKPDWILKEEIAAIAAKTREDVLNEAEPPLVTDYEKNSNSVLSETMKERFVEHIKQKYVDDGILSENGLTLLSAEYLDAF